MRPYQPGKAAGGSSQQLYRQVQITANEALRTLDAARPVDPANQAEVESLRGAIWSDLTGLEAEFGREEGPRADRLERFFNHLLSNGDHIGQIEALGGALLGAAPPSQPLPDSPVAGLHRLHHTLHNIRQQWQELSQASAVQSPAADRIATGWKNSSAHGANPAITEKQETGDESHAHGRRVPASNPLMPPRKGNGSELLLNGLNLGGGNPPAMPSDVEPIRPRVWLSFIAVFVVLMLLGVGIIYWGLSDTQAGDIGPLPTADPTFPLGTVTLGTPQTTPSPNPGAPRLLITGIPLELPCPGTGNSSQFLLSNTGGGILTWTATVKPQGAVSLDITFGQLLGGPTTSNMTITVTALVTQADGTITINTNIPAPNNAQQVPFHIHGC